jgi:hypothetical protein
MLEPKNLQNGSEQYEKFRVSLGIGRKSKTKYQYDYRHRNGELFSVIKSTIAECRAARDNWITAKFGK